MAASSPNGSLICTFAHQVVKITTNVNASEVPTNNKLIVTADWTSTDPDVTFLWTVQTNDPDFVLQYGEKAMAGCSWAPLQSLVQLCRFDRCYPLDEPHTGGALVHDEAGLHLHLLPHDPEQVRILTVTSIRALTLQQLQPWRIRCTERDSRTCSIQRNSRSLTQ